MMIKVAFSDMPDSIAMTLLKILQEIYDEIEVCDNPDFLFCGTFGHKHFDYNCIKIYYTGEDAIPDFNLFDYGIGFAPISFSDRYLRFPLFYLYNEDYKKAETKHINLSRNLANRKFCNFIYSNGNAAPERDIFFELLCKYKTVDSGGRYKNNIGNFIEDKLLFQSGYKFSIAFENSYSKGYTTEKILQAFAAKTIPIYWGNPQVAEDFNSKAFINCHEYNSFEEVLERVIELDSDNDKYMNILSEPICNEYHRYNEELNKLKIFFKHICNQPPLVARRRGTGTWNKKYNQNLSELYLQNDKIQRFTSSLFGKLILKFTSL